MMRVSITPFQGHTDKYETKDEMPNSVRIAIKCLLKKLKALYAEFKLYNFAVVDLMKEEEAL